MSADVHETILDFCIENNIPQNKAVALLREIVEDMNGDGDTYDFSFVANAYSQSKNAAQQNAHSDGATVCPKCNYMAKYPICVRCGTSIPAPQVA